MSDTDATTPPYPAARSRSLSGDEIRARQTFLRLLVRPLVSANLDRQLFRDVLRYAKQIDGYCKRLDYRRTRMGDTIRLIRNPILGTVTAPTRPLEFPRRRILTLTALLAAACEEVEGGVTLVRLSEIVAEISRTTDRVLVPYNPDQLPERRALARAAAELESWGVLRKRTTLIADVQEWTESRTGIGAGYDVDRDALLLFVVPDTIALAAYQEAQLAQVPGAEAEGIDGDPDPVHAQRTQPVGAGFTAVAEDDSPAAILEAQRQATRVVRHLRTLVETPALLYADLPPDEAELARIQRGLRADTVIGLIGGSIEARSEGLIWINRDEECPATVEWPTAKTDSWAALMVADKAGRDGRRDAHGFVHLERGEVDDVVEDLMEWKGHLFRKDLQGRPAEVRSTVEAILQWLGLLRLGQGGSWRLSPVVGRYRDPELIEPEPASHQADLFSDIEPDAETEPTASADPRLGRGSGVFDGDHS